MDVGHEEVAVANPAVRYFDCWCYNGHLDWCDYMVFRKIQNLSMDKVLVILNDMMEPENLV